MRLSQLTLPNPYVFTHYILQIMSFVQVMVSPCCERCARPQSKHKSIVTRSKVPETGLHSTRLTSLLRVDSFMKRLKRRGHLFLAGTTNDTENCIAWFVVAMNAWIDSHERGLLLLLWLFTILILVVVATRRSNLPRARSNCPFAR
jgi:hypothetical protein